MRMFSDIREIKTEKISIYKSDEEADWQPLKFLAPTAEYELGEVLKGDPLEGVEAIFITLWFANGDRYTVITTLRTYLMADNGDTLEKIS